AWFFYISPIFTLALFPLLARVAKDKRMRLLMLIGAVAAVILSVSIYFSPHYVAPYTVLIYAVILQGLRHVRTWRFRGKEIGFALVRAIPVICVVLIGFRAAAEPLHWSLLSDAATWSSYFTPDYLREDVINGLKRAGGKHLVIVRYTPAHVAHQEWVYNEADIDAAPVVWAREMSPAKNTELFRYFADRKVWLLEPDVDVLKLTPYPTEPRPEGSDLACRQSDA